MTDDHRSIVEGLAAIAITLAEMGETEADARAQLVGMMVKVRVQEHEAVQVARDAAAAVGTMPQPLLESADETERARPIREMVGLPSVEAQLVAHLTAREWLQNLAATFEANAKGD